MIMEFIKRQYLLSIILCHQNVKYVKGFLLLLLFNFVATISFSQISQNGIFFQAIAKDNYDNPANRRQLFIQSSIIQSNANGSKVLIEEFQTTTDQLGIFNFTIGKGVRKGGKFYNLNEIDWANGPYYLNIKIVITPVAPGANWDYNKEWVDIGTTSFGTVPYALYASSSGDLGNKVDVSDSIIRYVTPTQLAAKSFDISPILKRLSDKLDKVDGKQLSSNDYTNAEKIILNEISGINTGDETLLSIKSKLGISVLNGVNTGDQDLSLFATKSALDLNNKTVDSALSLKANILDFNTGLGLKANITDISAGLLLKVDKVSGLGLSSNDYTSAEKLKLTNISGINTGDQDLSSYATIANLGLKANITDVNTSLALKSNSTEVISLLNTKANLTDVNSSLTLMANIADLNSGLNLKVDKEAGKALSSNDYTSADKLKLSNITGVNTGDQDLSSFATITNLSLKANSNDVNTNLALKANITDVNTSLGLKANSADLTSSLAFKANITDVNTSLGLKANSADLTSSLALKANVTDVVNDLALKSNSTDLVTGLSLKEDQINKSTATNLGGLAANDILYPTQKAVKNYVDGQISSGGVADGSILTRHIASLNISNGLIANGAITDEKISPGINPSKIGLNNVENTALSTWSGSGNLISVGTITSGVWSGTSVSVTHGGTGASSAFDARRNLGLEIGTNVQAPLVAGTNYIVPNTLITSATKTKITYDIKGLVTSGADATTLDIAPSSDRNYVTDIQSGVLSNTSGINTGDETRATIKIKLGITTLSGDNTGDETTATLKDKLGITTLSGTNTGDQDLSSFATITNLSLKANSSDVTASLSLKANTSDVNTSLGLKASSSDLTSGLALKANTTDMTTSLGLKANASDLVSELALKVDKVSGKELSTNDYTSAEKLKLSNISGTNTGDQTIHLTGIVTGSGNGTFTTTIADGAIANSLLANSAVASLSGINTGDETTTTIKSKLGITTLTGANTGDQDLSSFATITNLSLKANSTDVTASLSLKANTSDVTTALAAKANTSDVTTSLALKANLISPNLTTPVLGDATATSITASSEVKAKRFTQYTTSAISSTSTTTIDLSRGNVIHVDLANSITSITFSNEAVGTYLIKFVQTVGAKTVNFPDSWLWSGGVEPVVSATLGRTDIVTLIYDGTNYYAAIVQNFY